MSRHGTASYGHSISSALSKASVYFDVDSHVRQSFGYRSFEGFRHNGPFAIFELKAVRIVGKMYAPALVLMLDHDV